MTLIGSSSCANGMMSLFPYIKNKINALGQRVDVTTILDGFWPTLYTPPSWSQFASQGGLLPSHHTTVRELVAQWCNETELYTISTSEDATYIQYAETTNLDPYFTGPGLDYSTVETSLQLFQCVCPASHIAYVVDSGHTVVDTSVLESVLAYIPPAGASPGALTTVDGTEWSDWNHYSCHAPSPPQHPHPLPQSPSPMYPPSSEDRMQWWAWALIGIGTLIIAGALVVAYRRIARPSQVKGKMATNGSRGVPRGSIARAGTRGVP